MDRPIRCIVCDDEYLGRQNIKQALSSFPGWELVAELDSGNGLPAVLDRWHPDIIFMDIRMPGRSGIDAIRDIVLRTDPPEVIFITAFDQYAIQAFELYALDYILKPFDEQRLAQSIARAEKAVEVNRRLQVPAGSDSRRYLTRLSLSSISKIELVDVSLNYFEQNLNPAMFVRCHRSSIARIDKIRDLVCLGDTKYEVVLANNAKVRMSSTYKDAVMAALEKGSWK
jgi:two-component system, LytTR family, response regulator